MPSKPLPPAAKLSLMLSFFHTSGTAHPLKDLEKSLPLAAGISGMHVKDYLQALSDEGLIKVEKIGSGNWYWSFIGDERKRKEGVQKGLEKEQQGLKRTIESLRDALEIENGRLAEGDGDTAERGKLVMELAKLEKKKAELTDEVGKWKDLDPVEVERKQEAIKKLKAETNRVTDNLYILLAYIRVACSNDKETMVGIWTQYLGGGIDGGEGELEYIE